MFDDRQQRERRAAATRASIEHPNLLPARLVRDRGRQDVRLVLKKSSAPRLDEVMASQRPSPRDCLQILYDAACGVEALNRHGLVASNLVPRRILVDPKRGGILADPGMPAELSGRMQTEPDPEAVYRSPEERAGRPVDRRSNVYSLGVILSTALNGGPPTGLPDTPTAMDAVIAWATDVNPARRYSGPEELMFAAADALAADEAGRLSTEAAPARAKRRQRTGRARPAPPWPRAESAGPRASSAATVPAKTNGHGPPDLVRPAPNMARPAGAKRDSGGPRHRLAWARRSLRTLAGPAAVLAGAVLVSAFAGVLLGRSGGDETQEARIASSAVALRLASGWVEEAKAVGDTASLLTDAVAASPADEDDVAIVAGRVRNLVAAGRLLGTQEGAPPAGTRLGRLEAWRYTGLRPKPNIAATGYLAPTTGDPLLVICRAPLRDAVARLPECERMASTITLREGSGVPLFAIEAREKRVQRVLASLVRDRLPARRRLGRARLAAQQADAARRLENIYRRAAAELAAMPSGPGRPAHQELGRSLRATADAYRKLARAAAAVDRSRYRRAAEVVRESEAAVLREAAEARPV
jgi:hypothetical protein